MTRLLNLDHRTFLVPRCRPKRSLDYDVDVKLFADTAVIARTSSAFEIVTAGFERFIANAEVDHGLAYGVATAMMAVMTGWIASIAFRQD